MIAPKNEQVKEKKSGGRKAAILLVVTLLLIGNSISAFPPRDIMLGYDEGTDAKSMDSVYWVRMMTDEDSVVASDHRMSSMIFGYAERNSTWDRAPLTLNAGSFEEARDEMTQASLPSGTKRIDYVLIDENLKQGVIIYVWDEAQPLSAEALQKLETSNYTKLFDNGYAHAKDVDWFLRAAEAGARMAILPQVLLHRRLHCSNRSYLSGPRTTEFLVAVKNHIDRHRLAAQRTRTDEHGISDRAYREPDQRR